MYPTKKETVNKPIRYIDLLTLQNKLIINVCFIQSINMDKNESDKFTC
jgi:hypothetical protein